MSATNRTNAYAYGEPASLRILIFLILRILILLGGILGFFTKESLPPLFKVILGPMCIFSVFLLVLTHHTKTQVRAKMTEVT